MWKYHGYRWTGKLWCVSGTHAVYGKRTGRSVVRDRVLTGPLLAGEEYKGNNEAHRVTLGGDFPPHGYSSSKSLLLLHSGDDLGVLPLYLLVVHGKLA